ncbi:THAP domain-containing protein 11 [Diachasma alloeum]|uniref:THAP domain-containing protein 11 n=1 Tax=Diachasma alloeum TaxID=454923 RepID=UPI00073838C0|nr:THAP domain-containing protein 11 [Diachasma alloeum]
MDNIVRSKRNCCLVGCSNSEFRNPELHFYGFPGKSYETEREEKWIAAVKRQRPDGKPWTPNKNSRICSAHFVGGKKSNNMHDISYYPTIFPAVYNRKPPNEERIERLKNRNARSNGVKPLSKCDAKVGNDSIEVEPEEEFGEEVNQELEKIAVETSSVGIQTDPMNEQDLYNSNISFLYCDREHGKNDTTDVSIQTEINFSKPQREKIIIPEKYCKEMKDTGCGPDEPTTVGFQGYSDIKSDVTMRQLAGVTIQLFNILLNLVDDRRNNGKRIYYKSIGKENR